MLGWVCMLVPVAKGAAVITVLREASAVSIAMAVTVVAVIPPTSSYLGVTATASSASTTYLFRLCSYYDIDSRAGSKTLYRRCGYLLLLQSDSESHFHDSCFLGLDPSFNGACEITRALVCSLRACDCLKYCLSHYSENSSLPVTFSRILDAIAREAITSCFEALPSRRLSQGSEVILDVSDSYLSSLSSRTNTFVLRARTTTSPYALSSTQMPRQS